MWHNEIRVRVAAAVAQAATAVCVQPLAQELPRYTGVARKKNKIGFQ